MLTYIILATIIGTALSVQYGDEKFANIPITDGKFYAFCNGGNGKGPSIDIIDPNKAVGATGSVVSIKVDATTEWSDSVYMESCASKKPYVLVADREKDQIYVVDPITQKILKKVAMSEKPVHVYAVAQSGEFWAHADDAGVFDIINIDKATGSLFKEDLKVHAKTPGHGKLLFDEAMFPKGYASNTREPRVFEIDMKTHKPTRSFDFGSHNKSHPLYCPGTHGLAYSKVNGHIFATCSGVGLMEMNPTGNSFDAIARHAGVTGGQVYESPDEKHIVTLDKSGGAVHLLTPGATGKKASKSFPSIVGKGLGPKKTSGSPDKPVFTKNADGGTRLFVSLTSPNTGTDALAAGSGVGWVDLNEVEKNAKTAQTLNYIPAGSVKKGSRYTYRSIATGGNYVATGAAYPSDSLAVFPADFKAGATPKVAFYPTNAGVSRVRWVPNNYRGLYCKKVTLTLVSDDNDASQLLLGSLAIIFALFAY